MTPLEGMVEPSAQDAMRAAPVGDLIDRALFHAEAAAACRRGAPPPPVEANRLLWGAAAEVNVSSAGLPHSCALGLACVRIPDGIAGAALPESWKSNSEDDDRFKNPAPLFPRISGAATGGGVGAHRPTWGLGQRRAARTGGIQ